MVHPLEKRAGLNYRITFYMAVFKISTDTYIQSWMEINVNIICFSKRWEFWKKWYIHIQFSTISIIKLHVSPSEVWGLLSKQVQTSRRINWPINRSIHLYRHLYIYSCRSLSALVHLHAKLFFEPPFSTNQLFKNTDTNKQARKQINLSQNNQSKATTLDHVSLNAALTWVNT